MADEESFVIWWLLNDQSLRVVELIEGQSREIGPFALISLKKRFDFDGKEINDACSYVTDFI